MTILDEMPLIESLEQLEDVHEKIQKAFRTVGDAFQAIQLGVERALNVDDFIIKEERQLLKQTINMATSRLSQLKTRLNMLTPINKLPTELLIRILLLAATPIRKGSHPYVIYTGVCRHWRSVIIHNPDFWTLIQPVSDPFIHQVVQRSKSAELNIIVRDGYSFQFVSALQNIFAEESHRIRMLQLSTSGINNSLDENLLQLVLSSKHFPALRGLALGVFEPFYPSLPVLASSNHLETLKCVLNDNVPVDQLMPIFRRLKNLSLSLSPPRVPAFALIQSLLSNSTMLQYLRLDANIPSDLTIDRKIIPRLQFLSIPHPSLLQYFQTPKLSGLDAYWVYPRAGTSNYPILQEFDFSSVEYLYIVPPDYGEYPFTEFCILGSKVSLHDESWFPTEAENFHRPYLISNDINTTLPRYDIDIFSEKFPCDCLRLRFKHEGPMNAVLKSILSSMLTQSTSLKELYFFPYDVDISSQHKWDHTHLRLEEIIPRISSVQKLAIAHIEEFLSFIHLFRNPDLLPRLKHLYYTSDSDLEDHDYNYLETVGKELTECIQLRQKVSAFELEFIALRCRLPDTWLERLDSLGIKVVADTRLTYML